MAMRLPRINLTKWTIVVATVVATIVVALDDPNAAIITGVPIRAEIHDAAHYRRLVEKHALLERQNIGKTWALMRTPNGKSCVYSEQPTPLSEYHSRLKRKYEEAALHPEIPVFPDPPPPAS